MNAKRILILACLILAGCTTNPPYGSPDYVNRAGLSEAVAKDRSVSLAPGKSQALVVGLFGAPDDTSAQTYGGMTSSPWPGVQYTYVFSKGSSHHKLIILFQSNPDGSLTVNGWHWES